MNCAQFTIAVGDCLIGRRKLGGACFEIRVNRCKLTITSRDGFIGGCKLGSACFKVSMNCAQLVVARGNRVQRFEKLSFAGIKCS